MTCDAPRERTRFAFRELHTPVTSAPNDLAICTAKVPTPPDAPLIRTFWPGWTFARSRRACRAVRAATGKEAACWNVNWLGILANARSNGQAYSAREPRQVPNASSPGLNWVTFLPTASTRPAISAPSHPSFGFRKPIMTRPAKGMPRRRCQSSGFMDALNTLRRTWSSLGTGVGISRVWMTSGEPNFANLAAFMGAPPKRTARRQHALSRCRSEGRRLHSSASRLQGRRPFLLLPCKAHTAIGPELFHYIPAGQGSCQRLLENRGAVSACCAAKRGCAK